MNWDKTFKKIESHFGFKLHDWQKDYVSMKIDSIPVGGRANGKTFAYVLRHLLNYEVKLGDYKCAFVNAERTGQYWLMFSCDESERNSSYTKHWYPKFVMDIDQELKSIGLDTCFL